MFITRDELIQRLLSVLGEMSGNGLSETEVIDAVDEAVKQHFGGDVPQIESPEDPAQLKLTAWITEGQGVVDDHGALPFFIAYDDT